MADADLHELPPHIQAAFDRPDAALRELDREDSKSLLGYIKLAWPILEPGRKLVTGWPIEAVCDHLEAVSRGEIKRLLITVPPGSMKSLAARVFWPTWMWGPNERPETRFIGASYARHLAERDNRKARSVITSRWYQDRFKVPLSQDQSTKINFSNEYTGSMLATSVGGVGTGERGDVFTIDDPHNVLDAESAAKRAEALNWFLETVPSRLNDLDEDAIIVIMQRVHEEDVAGKAIELGYDHLLIPMHFDPERAKPTSIGWRDPRTKEDELMWPDRFSAGAVKSLQETLGPYAAAAQLEQSPVPRRGGLFKVDRIRMIDELPDDEFVECRAWDLAASEGDGAYTVGTKIVYAKKSRRFIIASVERGRLGPHAVRKLILEVAEDDGYECMIRVPQDPGQAGKAQVADIIADLAGFKVRAEAQTGSKETRAEPLAAQIEAGNVDVLNRPWTKALLDEFKFFPKGKYADQVDASASAFNALSRRRRKKISELFVSGEKRTNPAKVS